MTTVAPPASLYDRTISLVSDAPRSLTLTQMSKDTGIPIAWISRFASGGIPNPGVHYVQRLHDYLANVGTVTA